MGILNDGLFGGFNGRVGKLVGYKLLGKDVVRTIGKNTVPPSLLQLVERAEFSITSSFLKPLKEFIRIGFAVKAAKLQQYPYNAAMGYNKKNALQGVYPELSVDYKKVLLCDGSLPGAEDVTVEPVAEGLLFSWKVDGSLPWPGNTDQVMLLAYFPELQKALFVVAGPAREEGKAVLKIWPELRGMYMETYLSFVAVDRKNVACSVYCGALNLF